MPMVGEASIHELDFCSLVATYSKAIFDQSPNHSFANARIEGKGPRQKRKDLRFYDRSGHLALCGEVKLPGTAEGRSPYDDKLVRDAFQKADEAGVRYFFTWNVNSFVLWDRQLWEVPLLDRRVREWQLGLNLLRPEDVGRTETLQHIEKRFLPHLLHEIATIYRGERQDWGMPPDDIFIRSLESHLHWPVLLCRDWLVNEAEQKRSFDSQLQEWMVTQDWTFVRNDPGEWAAALDRTARSLAYILVNRLIFYKALRDRFDSLPQLRLTSSVRTADEVYKVLQNGFERAVKRSGDYEPLFYPHERDWASQLVFQPPGALDAWRIVLRAIENYDFKKVPTDVVGRIFQRLVSPEERHRYGQHFTSDDVVDLINSFCIRTPNATVLDPACGSGSFLVRAYYRKKVMGSQISHQDLISQLFGCDIALYPAHLATLNLAAREINEETNYPRIARKDFFHVTPRAPFCSVPEGPNGSDKPIMLPQLDAVVANPPYVRQEKIQKGYKDNLEALVKQAWPGLRLSGRSDLHCYFWPTASRFLHKQGYFGFLTSSSWLDVEYGFLLQGWVLTNFKLRAVLESAAEPWFPDARVKTCVTILERCDDETARMANNVKFVQFKKPLQEIVKIPTGQDELIRQQAFEQLRDRIESATSDESFDDLRIIVKNQGDLWRDGIRASQILGTQAPTIVEEEDDEEEPDSDGEVAFEDSTEAYKAGKWGRYVRAPDLYFDIVREFGSKLVPLGTIATIRFGVKTGCDAFFMPHDVTNWALTECEREKEFRNRFGIDRHSVATGKIKIVQAGDDSVHPIEAKFLKLEVHSLMQVDRPVVQASSLNRLVLLVGEPLSALGGTWVARYIHYGQTQTFSSAKSKPVPVPKRSTCAARDPWYDLTHLVKPGFAFWPKSQQYRHFIPANPEKIICNCNLYDIAAIKLSDVEQSSLLAILNSTLVSLFKTFYGRFAGTEGNLKTEVVDVKMLEVPDPRGVSPVIADKLAKAFQPMINREVGHLVEEALRDCHSPERAKTIAMSPIVLSEELLQSDRRSLDDAVFELLGVTNPFRRRLLADRLYDETALHFRNIRVVEIQKMQQRSATGQARRFSADELAAEAWEVMELENQLPLREWLREQPASKVVVSIPMATPATLRDEFDLYDNKTVYFGKDQKISLTCHSRHQAELGSIR